MGKTSRTAKKQTKKTAPTPSKSSESEGQSSSPPAAPRNVFLRWFSDFPLSAATFTVLMPYCLYMLYYIVQLQHPEWVAPVLNLRPPVKPSEPRQLLIVSTIGSGTVQVATDLSKKLGIEIGHEVSDAYWYFCRDGTVSWFHGIRFFEQKIPKPSMYGLCTNTTTENMGFHPRMYRRHSECNSYESWSSCWETACYIELVKEWSCASNDTCRTPFATTLHQVRNPLRVIESLVVKFCQGGLEGDVHPAFLQTVQALFPEEDFDQDSCIEAAGKYVLRYTQVLLRAREKGYIDGWYRVEETSPCEVARLAGFLDENTAVSYKRNHVQRMCAESNDKPHLHQPFAREENKRNKGLVALTYSDLRGGVHGSKKSEFDTELEESIRSLAVSLGYSIAEEATEQSTSDSSAKSEF